MRFGNDIFPMDYADQTEMKTLRRVAVGFLYLAAVSCVVLIALLVLKVL